LTSTPVLAAREKKGSRLTRSSKILKVITKAIQDKKGENIISMDLRKIPEAIADFFVICEATSTTQVKAIADYVEVSVKESCGENAYHHEGRGAMQWIIIDYINVVVHVFLPETRSFYQLEEMWSDAAMEELNETMPVKKNTKKNYI
jgi:ribosome-associated protein